MEFENPWRKCDESSCRFMFANRRLYSLRCKARCLRWGELTASAKGSLRAQKTPTNNGIPFFDLDFVRSREGGLGNLPKTYSSSSLSPVFGSCFDRRF